MASLFRSKPSGPSRVYVSYHKCATQFVERVLRDACKLHGLRARTFDSRHDEVPPRVLKRTDFLMLTDFSSSMVALSDLGARGVYVVRDPRDILVSMYFSHRYSHVLNHPEIQRDRAVLSELDTVSGLRYLFHESRFFARIVREMADWEKRDLGYYETSFETLTADPHTAFTAILEHLDLAVEPEALAATLDRYSFSALQSEWARKNPGSEANHYRSGEAGDWRQHLPDTLKEEFEDRHGGLLRRLGYGP